MSLEAVKEARQQITEAQKVLRDAAEKTVKDELEKLFTDPTIQNVTWAQKAGEYNDEGMYPGVFGPAINAFEGLVDRASIRDWSYEDGYDMIYYGGMTVDPRAKRFEEVLNALGDDILSDMFGNENVTVAVRTEKGATIVSEYVGC